MILMTEGWVNKSLESKKQLRQKYEGNNENNDFIIKNKKEYLCTGFNKIVFI